MDMSSSSTTSAADQARDVSARDEADRPTVAVLTTWDEARRLRRDWRSLFASNPRMTPFQSFTWADRWWRCVGSTTGSNRPLIAAVYARGGSLIGLVPLMTRRPRPAEGGASPSSTGEMDAFSSPWSDYHDVVCARGAGGAVIQAAAAVLPCIGASAVVMSDVAAPSEAAVATVGAKGWRWRPERTCSSITLSAPGARTTAFARREYERKFRRMQERGDVELAHYSGDVAVGRISLFLEMHQRQWAHRSDTVAGFDEEGVADLYRELVGTARPDIHPILSELTCAGAPVAYYFGFVSGTRYWAYRPAFDVDLQRLSPGHLMLTLLCDDLRGRGYRTFDLMRGDYGYKALYLTHRVPQGRLELSRR